jgi:rare lipoprotein A
MNHGQLASRPGITARTARRGFALALLALALVVCQGCPGKKNIPGGDPGYGTGSAGQSPRGTRPYTINGRTYYPLFSADGYGEEGIASWYGGNFHGKTTANGEVYDMYGMTAAHKLLPFGTMVRVTHLENGRSVIVRVNDRGPFVENRIIDLTRAGAEQLGMIQTGTARVRVETLGAVPGLTPGTEQGTYDLRGVFYVQVGAFSNPDNARNLVAALKNRGLSARGYYAEQVGFWRVQIGPYPSVNNAEAAAARYAGEFPGNFVVAE